MEGKEQNLISIIVIAVFLLAPMIFKLLGKKFGVKQTNAADEKPDDDVMHPLPLEIPRPPKVTSEPDNEMQSGRRVFSDKPIKPKWF
jgi:hypothetical protein